MTERTAPRAGAARRVPTNRVEAFSDGPRIAHSTMMLFVRAADAALIRADLVLLLSVTFLLHDQPRGQPPGRHR